MIIVYECRIILINMVMIMTTTRIGFIDCFQQPFVSYRSSSSSLFLTTTTTTTTRRRTITTRPIFLQQKQQQQKRKLNYPSHHPQQSQLSKFFVGFCYQQQQQKTRSTRTTFLSLSSSSSSSSSISISISISSEELIELQKMVSTLLVDQNNINNKNNNNEGEEKDKQEEKDHNHHQRQVFNELAEHFRTIQQEQQEQQEMVPTILQYIANQMIDTVIEQKRMTQQQQHEEEQVVVGVTEAEDDVAVVTSTTNTNPTIDVYHLLDVACGTGVLWEYLFKAVHEYNEKELYLYTQQAQQPQQQQAQPQAPPRFIQLHITGIDLSDSMIQIAKQTAKQQQLLLLQQQQIQQQKQQQVPTFPFPIHTIRVIQSDINQFTTTSTTTNNNNHDTTTMNNKYQIVVLNACFGNFYNQTNVLHHIVYHLMDRYDDESSLNENNTNSKSTLYITHPLGYEFVQQLHDHDRKTVPHTLPSTKDEWINKFLYQLPLQLLKHQTSMKISSSIIPKTKTKMIQKEQQQDTVAATDHCDQDNNDNKDTDEIHPVVQVLPMYFSSFVTTSRVKPLPIQYLFRGVVCTGYGRGGKKLGFPTANLSPTLFHNMLVANNISNGVYIGYAVLEKNKKKNHQHQHNNHNETETVTETNHNNNQSQKTTYQPIYKAVVNVGFSPTFVGQENPLKIIEAHLICRSRNPSSRRTTTTTNTTTTTTTGILDEEREVVVVVDTTIPENFYGETMRLQLLGRLRSEKKFPNFPDLIKQIQMDVEDAYEALTNDHLPYVTYQNQNQQQEQENQKDHSFLFVPMNQQQPESWIGASGGDEEASWEFRNIY